MRHDRAWSSNAGHDTARRLAAVLSHGWPNGRLDPVQRVELGSWTLRCASALNERWRQPPFSPGSARLIVAGPAPEMEPFTGETAAVARGAAAYSSRTATVWMARPASEPTTVPLMRMNCRSRPTCSSTLREVSSPSQRSTVSVMSVVISSA